MFTLLSCIFFSPLERVVPGSHTKHVISAEETSGAQDPSSSQSPPWLPLPPLPILLSRGTLPFPTSCTVPANTLHREAHAQDLWLHSMAMKRKRLY